MKDSSADLRTIWHRLTQSLDPIITRQVFDKIEKAYGSPSRHYHNLHHIGSMLQHLQEHESELTHPEAVYFACFFHDVVYDTSSTQNEEDSADFARENLRLLHVAQTTIEKTVQLILLTKSHVLSKEASLEEALFVDADIAILGSLPTQYAEYAQQIREEYGQYSDKMYHLGRKKVLWHFMAQSFLYHSFSFREKYERQARLNIDWELKTLAQ